MTDNVPKKTAPEQIAAQIEKIFNKRSEELKRRIKDFGPFQESNNFEIKWHYENSYCSKELVKVSIVSNVFYFKENPDTINVEIKNCSESILMKNQIIVYNSIPESDYVFKGKGNFKAVEPGKTLKIPCPIVKKIPLEEKTEYSIKICIALYDREEKKIIDLNESKVCQIIIDKDEAFVEELDAMFKFRSRFPFNKIIEVLKNSNYNLEKTISKLINTS